MKSISARDRFLATCRFQRGVIPPFWETIGFWELTSWRWHSEGLPPGVSPERYFQMESPHYVPWVSHFHPAVYPPYKKVITEEDETTVTYRNEHGVLVQEFKNDAETSMPNFLEYPVSNREDFEKIRMRLDPSTTGRYPEWNLLERTYAGREHVVGLMISGAFGFQRDLLGYERLAYMYYDDPGFVKEISRQWLALEKGICEEVLSNTEVDFVSVWEDMAFKNGPLVGPELYREFVLPYYKPLTECIRSKGVENIIIDSDGNNDLLMPLFLEGGSNGFLPIEAAAGMDPVRLRNDYGENLILCGGIDKRVLSKGEEEICREVESKIPYLVRSGGYIPAVDHSIPPDVSFENYRFFIEFTRDLIERTVRI